jgi:cation diffusion facilitator family transporter
MHLRNIKLWQHDHIFGQDKEQAGERRTILVTVVTFVMMVVEIIAGVVFGSMALLADGLHMASHATALGINSFAYIYARRHSSDKGFNFGTGKVNTLGGFTGAILLGFFALFMVWKSVKRMFAPVGIAFSSAIFVAVIGLVVNMVSVFILDTRKKGQHLHEHSVHNDDGHHHNHDYNLQSAYLHVLADALTSVLAIVALLSAKYFGLIRMDPLMGIIGGVMVFRWSLGLLRTTSHVLLDKNGPEEIKQKIKESIEADGDSKISDLHLWSVGPNIYGAILSVVACNPLEPEQYKRLIPVNLGLVHISVEVSKCKEGTGRVL